MIYANMKYVQGRCYSCINDIIYIVACMSKFTDILSFVRSSRNDETARSNLIATGKLTRKDSATWTANSGSVSELIITHTLT